MELHHQKHHQTYITNLNAALASQQSAIQANDVPTLISLQEKIKFNGGGHINHSLFWKNLTPPNSPEANIDSAAPTLKAAIEQRWGSMKGFTDAFNATLLDIKGSGWGWLVSSGPKGKLEIVSTHDQDPVTGKTPIFGVDMWEHAYYLQVLILYPFGLSFANAMNTVLHRQKVVLREHLEGHQLGYRGGSVQERSAGSFYPEAVAACTCSCS
jgi:Fe-Mn family superoxide dismutase